MLNGGAVVAGAAVGVIVGLTGSGGGSLLTPLLILTLGVDTQTAVSSDLVATLFMRPVAAAVHLRHRNVIWPVVGWLSLGSVPTAFLSGWAVHWIGSSNAKADLSPVVGVALLLTGVVAVARRFRPVNRASRAPFRARPAETLLIGVIGGALVGATSVGAGTLMLAALGALYPMLSSQELVGTDLVQAVPLVGAAALGHVAGHDLQAALTASVVVGAMPGALLGALLARRVPSRPLGLVIALLVTASGLALVGWPAALPGGLAVAAALTVWVVRSRPAVST
jgi:uncharacterized protein